ncbi:pyruvate dehydrogenase (acetyl-transferring) kinase, mitochondrial [Tanacetum coccineum]
MAETMEQYMSKTRTDYGSGVARPKIDNKYQFELKGQFLKVLRENTFSGSDNEDANEHIEKVLEIVDLFHVPNITVDELMLRIFPISLTGAASRWLRNEPTGSIKTWEDLKTKFLNKYCPPGQTAKKMEEINKFQQEPDETLFQAWERFKELLMKGAIPTKTTEDAKKAIQEMAEYSQKWHNGTLRGRRREIKKVDEKVYAAQVGCKQCKGPHYTKDCPQKEEGKTLEEAYYTQFGGPFQGGGYQATAPGYYQRKNANPSYQEQRQSMEDTLSKFMSESAKRHKENSNLFKEIQATTDATIRNQGASIKTLEIQIGQNEQGASVSVMPLLTYLNLGLDFIILDMPEDIKVPLILGRPFLSNARSKIDVYKRKITLRVREENIIFKSIKPASSLIRRVYMLGLRERMGLDLEARLMGETLVLNRPLNPFLEDYIELNDLNKPVKLRRNEGDDLMPTIVEGEVIEDLDTVKLEYDPMKMSQASKRIHGSQNGLYDWNCLPACWLDCPPYGNALKFIIPLKVLLRESVNNKIVIEKRCSPQQAILQKRRVGRELGIEYVTDIAYLDNLQYRVPMR